MPAEPIPVEETLSQSARIWAADRSVLSSVISHIPYVIFWKDHECRYLGCNLEFAKLVGLDDPEDIVGLTDFDLPWDTEETIAYRADDMEVMDTNTPKLHIVETQVSFDGIKSYLDTSKAPLRNNEGKVVGIIGIYVDVTEKRAMAAQLAQSSKLESIGQLAAGIAHEINTPAQFVGDNIRFTADCFTDLIGFIAKSKTLAAAVAQGDACSELAAEILKDVEVADIDFIEQEIPVTF
ncbi:MAG: PAS domain-containing protein [Gammaproteobacteria bacterium]